MHYDWLNKTNNLYSFLVGKPGKLYDICEHQTIGFLPGLPDFDPLTAFGEMN